MRILERVVLNWYNDDIGISSQLIETFVENIEKQAKEYVAKYEKETYVLREAPAPAPAPETPWDSSSPEVEVYQGLDDATWNLSWVFGEHFPSLQRRSALLTICSYFEHELDELCLLYQSEKNFRLNLSDLNGKGVNRSTSYLEKVAGLNVYKTSQEWAHIKNIQTIRNVIVHRDGRLRDHQGNPNKVVMDYINQMDSLLSGSLFGEITLKEGFLSHVVSTYNNYFKLIDGSIKETETKYNKQLNPGTSH